MGTQTFQVGTIIEYGKKIYQLKREVDDEIWQVENIRTGRVEELSLDEMRNLYLEKKLKFESSSLGRVIKRDKDGRSYLDGDSFELAKERLFYVKNILDIPSTHKSVETQVKQLMLDNPCKAPPPSASTLLRLKKLYINSGRDITSLVPRHNKKGNRTDRYEGRIFEIVDDVIKEKYLCSERHTVQDVIDEVKARIKISNHLDVKSEMLEMPSRNFVQTRVRGIPEFDKVASRYGYTAAIHRFRFSSEVPVVTAPLDRVEIDHTKLDLFVIDEETGAVLGRPWVTLCIDVFSRSILGLHIGFDDPSYLTVSYCLKHAFLPKTDVSSGDVNIRNSWKQHGVMKELVVDNGMEFHSKSLENTCYSLGIEIHYAARKTPWFKGKVERFFRELNGGVAHKSPGTSFSNIFEKGDYDPKKHAVMRYSRLKPIIRKWIVDVYHQKPHSSLQVSPLDMWNENISGNDIALPEDLDFLDATLGKSDVRTLTHKGIEYDRVFYRSKELEALRRASGENLKVDIRVDDSDIGQIMVISPDTGEILKVPSRCSDYAEGTSRSQHKIIQNYTIKKKRKNNSDSWLLGKHEISELIKDEMLNGKRLKTRSRAAKFREKRKSAVAPKEDILEERFDYLEDFDEPALDNAEQELEDGLNFKVSKRKDQIIGEVGL